MSDMAIVALDAMGGDYAPAEQVKGAAEAVNERDDIKVLLVGDKTKIEEELDKYTFDKEKIEVVHASEVILNDESPTKAIREKKDSSIVVAMRLVHEGKADAVVSSGSTGALLVGGQLLVGRIKGIKRTPLAPFIPTRKGASLLIDCGANV
ncbi:MAG: phosphate acyltransferase, partial [Lachnoclostridium sp.]|nr:phosphate acyltransferase [Lachnoclostridium sp.]